MTTQYDKEMQEALNREPFPLELDREPPSPPLTAKQARFIEAYLLFPSASQAAISAGYRLKHVASLAAKLVNKPHIRKIIEERQAERNQRCQVQSDDVLRKMVDIAFADTRNAFADDGSVRQINTLEPGVAALITGLETKTTPDGNTTITKIKFSDRNKLFELLGRHLGMFNDRLTIEQQQPRALASLDVLTAELVARGLDTLVPSLMAPLPPEGQLQEVPGVECFSAEAIAEATIKREQSAHQVDQDETDELPPDM